MEVGCAAGEGRIRLDACPVSSADAELSPPPSNAAPRACEMPGVRRLVRASAHAMPTPPAPAPWPPCEDVAAVSPDVLPAASTAPLPSPADPPSSLFRGVGGIALIAAWRRDVASRSSAGVLARRRLSNASSPPCAVAERGAFASTTGKPMREASDDCGLVRNKLLILVASMWLGTPTWAEGSVPGMGGMPSG